MTNDEEPVLPVTNTACEIFEIPDPIIAVYFLIKDGKVMYVGKTQNLFVRAFNHQDTKLFDEIRFIRCKLSELNDTERYWIQHYKPPWKSLTINNPSHPRFKRRTLTP